jgi:glycosyltransferase involved in cell wall biosynthesis
MLETHRNSSQPRITVVGETFAASRTVQRVKAMRALGCVANAVATTPPDWNYETRPSLMRRIRERLRVPGDPADANHSLLAAVRAGTDVLWIEAAKMIRAQTLRQAKSVNARLVIIWYSEDDMMNRRHRSILLDTALPLFDLWVTTKSFNARPHEMPSRGAGKILFVNNSCDPDLHRPIKLGADDRQRLGAPISFVGSFEEPRARSLLYLADKGFSVRVWGNGWGDWIGRHRNLMVENRPVYNDDYARVVCASALNLGFLRKSNRDFQTCRSIEIPACAGFMVHERNPEITGLLREGREAVYWSSDEELAAVCGRWMDNESERQTIGRAGRERVLELGLTHEENIRRILAAAKNETEGSPRP